MSESFAPLTGEHLHTLILGTMPGQKSLQTQRYYAHPRNALWPILCALVNHEPPQYSVHTELSYEQRCQMITSSGFGLWDVLASCEREGSLDSNIVKASEVPNAINELATSHPELHTIACNGRTAEALFKRHIKATMTSQHVRVVCLPSTSPAMASLSLEGKYQLWHAQLTNHTDV